MKILAHRGASKQAPENTLKAFTLAFEQGADGIEFDLYQCQEQSWIIHDRWLERTTNGTGLVIEQDEATLSTLNTGGDQSIPTLRQTLSLVPRDKIANIELKHLRDIHTWLAELLSICRDIAFPLDNLVISSFNHVWLHQLKQLNPQIKIAALTASLYPNLATYACDVGASSANIALDMITQEYVEDAHHKGLEVWVYTVDHPADMRMLKNWGVDGIFTNLPDLALATLGR